MGYRIVYDQPYALIQHENLTFNHPTPGTKAKYLEGPFNKLRGKIRAVYRRYRKLERQAHKAVTGS